MLEQSYKNAIERLWSRSACRIDLSLTTLNVKEGPGLTARPFFHVAYASHLLQQVRTKETRIPIARWGVVVLPHCTSSYSGGYAISRRVTTGPEPVSACVDRPWGLVPA